MYLYWVIESKEKGRKTINSAQVRVRKREEKFIRKFWGGDGAAHPMCARRSGAARQQCAKTQSLKFRPFSLGEHIRF